MQFTKLQGAGNDYVYVNGLTETRDWAELSRRIADRHGASVPAVVMSRALPAGRPRP